MMSKNVNKIKQNRAQMGWLPRVVALENSENDKRINPHQFYLRMLHQVTKITTLIN